MKAVLLSVLVVWTGVACSRLRSDDASAERSLSLVVSLKNVVAGGSYATKVPSSVTQSDGEFRGIEQLYVVPFQTEASRVGPAESRLGRQNVVLGNVGIGKTGLVPNNNSHVFGSAIVPNGMTHVLTYGKAPDEGEDASKESKHTYGVLTSDGLANPASSDDITFRLESILAADEAQEAETVADNLLEQLNVVMSLMGNSQFASIVSIYDIVKRENQILACSYSTFNQIRNEIQSALWRIPYESEALLQEIRQLQGAIGSFSDLLQASGASFPNQYGIPEGAFGFWWNGTGFVRLINSVNIALVNPANYCYPPSLWYYANSAIKTSMNENVRNQYVKTNEYWDDVLGHYTDGELVNSFTEAVAIVDQLQYGVGLMELSLAEPGTEAANLVSGCPLTGIIVGDQNDVDFRFLPVQGQGRYTFDNTVSGLSIGGPTGNSIQTLVLQTEDNKPVHFALEFRNTTGLTRTCQQGSILPWCKFYLAGVLDPAEGTRPQSSTETFNSVFSQDHKTRVTVKVESLRSAYNTVPDLHSPQLEIGIVTEMKWTQVTPQSIVLDF